MYFHPHFLHLPEIQLCFVCWQVLSITVSRKDDGASLAPQAHVAWYGSSTSSLMPCDQLSPFLETFKVFVLFTHPEKYRTHFRFQCTCRLHCDALFIAVSFEKQPLVSSSYSSVCLHVVVPELWKNFCLLRAVYLHKISIRHIIMVHMALCYCHFI